MSRGLNRTTIIGNLGHDPEVKTATSGTTVANFSVAVTEGRKNKDGEWEDCTEWIRVVAFGKTADVCSKYLHKGSKVYIEGRLQTRSWEDESGQKKHSTEIVCNQMLMLDGRSDGGGGQVRAQATTPPTPTPSEPPADDDDLPF